MPKESYKEKAPPTPISTSLFTQDHPAMAATPEIRAVRGRPTRRCVENCLIIVLLNSIK